MNQNAVSMMEAVVMTERQILEGVADLISLQLDALSERTDLVINGVDFSLKESTSVDSIARQWVVTGCQVNVELPPKISLF